jgi:TonB family protein
MASIPRNRWLPILLLLAAPVLAAPAQTSRVLHGVANERVTLDGSTLAYAWTFDVERRIDVMTPQVLDRVRFGNARASTSGVAALDQGPPRWSGLVGWHQVDPAQGPQLDGDDVARALARFKRRIGGAPEGAAPDVDAGLGVLVQVESAARWRSWVGLWQPATTRAGWWTQLGGDAPAVVEESRAVDCSVRRTARYRLDAAEPPLAIPLGAVFWEALDQQERMHPLFELGAGVDVAVVEVAHFPPRAEWPSKVEVERRIGPDAAGRTWTLRQEIDLTWRAPEAPPPPPLADDSPWIEHAEPAPGADGDREPYYRFTRAPEYPEISRMARFDGSVMLRVTLDAAGVPTGVVPSRSAGIPDLDDAAIAAVREWRFWPKLRGCAPVASEVVVPVSFRLRDATGASDPGVNPAAAGPKRSDGDP